VIILTHLAGLSPRRLLTFFWGLSMVLHPATQEVNVSLTFSSEFGSLQWNLPAAVPQARDLLSPPLYCKHHLAPLQDGVAAGKPVVLLTVICLLSDSCTIDVGVVLSAFFWSEIANTAPPCL
jgi:hypothetical protein